VGFVLAVLGGIATAAAVRDVVKVRVDLIAARETMRRLVNDPVTLRTAEGRTAATAQITSTLTALAGTRDRLAGSIPITMAQAVPGLRAQRAGMLALVDDVSSAATAGRDLLLGAESIGDGVQVKDGSVPLDGIRSFEASVREAGQAIGGLARSARGLWGPLGDARQEFDELAISSSARLAGGADALRAAQSFMGATEDRRYLIAIQNNAEMRDQGMVLSYAVARFSGRRLIFEGSGSVGRLRLDRPTATPVPEGTEEVFGFTMPTRFWQSVNATADFAFSGQAMVDMYRQATGEEVDGVIAIDVPGIAALLRVLGPVQVPGIPEPVSAGNAARVLLKDLYDGLPPFDDRSDRRERLGEVTEAVIGRLTSGTTNAVAVGQELAGAALGGHFRLWSRVGEEEEIFERTGLGGGPAASKADRTFHVAVENRTATKLDYYVKPSVRQEVQLTRAGTAVVRTTVTIDNQAPADAAPSYQLGPDPFTKKPGDYVAWVLLWGPAGSRQLSGGVEESGLNLSQRVVDIAAAQRREVTFETVIPDAVRDGVFELRLVPQPRLEPMPAEVKVSAEGWSIKGDGTWTGVLNRVQILTWRVDR